MNRKLGLENYYATVELRRQEAAVLRPAVALYRAPGGGWNAQLNMVQ